MGSLSERRRSSSKKKRIVELYHINNKLSNRYFTPTNDIHLKKFNTLINVLLLKLNVEFIGVSFILIKENSMLCILVIYQ